MSAETVGSVVIFVLAAATCAAGACALRYAKKTTETYAFLRKLRTSPSWNPGRSLEKPATAGAAEDESEEELVVISLQEPGEPQRFYKLPPRPGKNYAEHGEAKRAVNAYGETSLACAPAAYGETTLQEAPVRPVLRKSTAQLAGEHVARAAPAVSSEYGELEVISEF